MRRLPALLAVGVVASSCGGESPIPGEGLSLRVETADTDVTLGKAFPLTVVRAWDRGLVAREWDDRALSPLSVRLEGVETRDDGNRVEETRHYRAYAFRFDEVAVPRARLRAVPEAGGAERVADSPPLRLRVARTLDPASPGTPEFPDEPPRRRFPWPHAIVAAALLAVAGTVVVRARRRPARPAAGDFVTAPVGAPPYERALAALALVRARGTASAADVRARVDEAGDVVRGYVEERLGVPAPRRTTEEVLRGGSVPAAGRLRAFLAGCDAVKFADAAAGDDGLVRILDDAEAFVRESAGAGAP